MLGGGDGDVTGFRARRGERRVRRRIRRRMLMRRRRLVCSIYGLYVRLISFRMVMS